MTVQEGFEPNHQLRTMRAYITVTGILFALIVAVHIWRAFEEGARVTREPDFLIGTLLAVGMSLWAARLLRRQEK